MCAHISKSIRNLNFILFLKEIPALLDVSKEAHTAEEQIEDTGESRRQIPKRSKRDPQGNFSTSKFRPIFILRAIDRTWIGR